LGLVLAGTDVSMPETIAALVAVEGPGAPEATEASAVSALEGSLANGFLRIEHPLKAPKLIKAP